MNIQYLYCDIYINQVIIIQKNYRMFKMRKRYLLLRSINKNRELVKDIREIGLMPPDREIGVLKRGGYIYREARNNYLMISVNI